ncbi:forkhead box protein fkh-2-like [Anastrepha obliqua]|uniref:forkhead box protein fkh-2-like n=1 Tax=Anastrepha obliqua TaxID=95512 RepID=UPI0024094057|nr:forkhead box protein fkh-2-like [Anastrepha obliqua]
MAPIFESNFSIRKILANNTTAKSETWDENNLSLTPPHPEAMTASDGEGSPNSELLDQRPAFTFSALVSMAIRSSPEKRLPLSAIQDWITENYPYYRKDQHGWQSQVRHTLSTNSCFIKMPRSLDDPGRGNYWALSPAVEGMKVNSASGRLQFDQSSAARAHFAIHSYGYPINHVMAHGVPMSHPQAPTAVYFPTPDELGQSQYAMMMQALQEQQAWFLFHHQRKQFLQQQLMQAQQQHQFNNTYHKMYQQMTFHQQQCEFLMSKKLPM